MILSTLADAHRYVPLHPRFAAAFDYLTSVDAARLVAGRHDLDGDDLFAIVWSGFGKGRAEAPLECHRQYLDIQYVLSGVDEIGWRPLADCQRVKQPYEAASDLAFFFDQPVSWCRVPARSLAIFYPEDAHAPLATTGPLKKIVVKVRLDAAK
jgi:YhcH/YjgK/YiaL family protein